MKTLSKLSSKKSKLPILNTVLVQNGTAIATDMDIEIRHEIYLNNGLYCGTSFDKVQIPFAGKEKNFPVMCDFEGLAAAVEISLESLEFVAQGTSKDENRYYLQGVCFDHDCMVTTDGNILLKSDLPERKIILLSDTKDFWDDNTKNQEQGYGLQEKIILPPNAVNYIISIMKELKAKGGILNIHRDGFIFTCGNYILKSKSIDGTFPNYPRVIPKDAPCVGHWNAAALKTIFREISLIAKTMDYKYPYVAFEGNQVKIKYDKYEKQWTIEGLNFPQKTGFNLAYAQKMPNGHAYIKSASDPMRIDCGAKQAVLMPSRLEG